MPTDPDRLDRAHAGDGAAPEAGARAGVSGPDAPVSGDGGPPASVPPPGPAARQRRFARRLGLGALVVVGVVALVAVAALAYLQTEGGRERARGLVVGQIANLFADDAEISAASLAGNFLTGARLTGLEVRRDGELVLAVDTVLVDYNLTTLLRRTFSASELYVGGPRLYVRQRADSTFNVAGLLKPADDDEQKAGFDVVLDRVALRRGLAEVHWYRADGRDSVHAVRDLRAVVRDFRQSGDSLAGDIEALSLRALAPFDRGAAEIAGAGRFSARALDLRDLSVASDAGTRLSGRARLAFAPADEDETFTLPVFDARLEAAPLALEDARAFAGVELYGSPRLRLTADSDGTVLTASLSGALDDATVTLDGELTRSPTGPVSYRAEGSLRRFDPAALTGDPALAADVTGDLRVDLRGTTLETLSGPFTVALRESRVSGRQIDRLRLDGSFASGRVSFDLDGALPGASLVAEGTARPFDDVPTFQIAGTAQDVDLGVLLPGSGRTDSFAGEFAVIGSGTSLDTFRGTVAADLSRVDIGLRDRRLRLAAAQVDANVSGGVAAFDADLTLPGDDGRIVAAGTLELGEPLRYDIPEGQAYGLNLAALTGRDTQDSDLTGAFTLSGEGLDLTQAPVDLTARLQTSRFGTYRLAGAALDVELRRGVASLDADLDFGPGGRLTAVGTARPFVQPLAFDLTGTMRNLDLAEVQNRPDRTSDLTGTYTASGTGLDPTTMALDARVQITEPSSYGARLVDYADLDVTLRAGALAVDGALTTPEGTFDLAFTGRPFDGSPSYAFDGTCFSDLDLSDFGAGNPRTDLNGCFTGRVADYADGLATADAAGTVTLRPSRINEAEIEDGTVRFTLDDGALDGALDLTLLSPTADEGVAAGGRVVASFAGRPFDETPTYALEGRTEGLDAGLLFDLPPDQPVRVSLDFDVRGRGTDPRTMTLDGRLAGGGSRLGAVALDTLAARFALADGVVRVDTLVVDSDLVDATGGGTLALFNETAASAFRLEGSVESLAPLAAASERTLGLERGSFVLQAAADAGAPLRVLGTVEARQLVVDDYAVTGLDASIDGTWDRADSLGLGAFAGQVRTEFAVLDGPTFRVERGRAVVATDGQDVTVDGSVFVDERREVGLFARVDPERDGVVLERGRLRLEEAEWTLLQPAEVTVRDGLIDVRGLLLASEAGGQQIAADGQIDFQGEQNLIVTVEDVPIDALTDFVRLDALGGDLSATLVLSGPAQAPRFDGAVRLDDLTSRGRPVGALDATVAYAAGGQLALDAVLTHVDGETLTVGGTVPFAFSLVDGPQSAEVADDAEVALRARADAFPIAWARPFLDDRTYSDLGGTLRLDLQIAGTQASPRLDGVATLQGGRLGVVATGRTYEPVVADVTFQNDRVVLDDVRVLDEAGRTALDVTGQIRFRELSVGELDLRIAPRDFLAMDTRTYDGLVLDGGSEPLRLTGTLDRPVLRGAVAVAGGDIYLTDELVPPDLEPVALTDAQIREVESRFGRVVTARDTAVSRFVDALDYDLTVEIRRDVWLRAESGLPFDIEFAGDVRATKAPFAESSRLFGRIDLVRGQVETLNRQFELEGGSITFNGDPLAAIVDLSATLDVRLAGSVAGQSSATITLAAQGQLDENPTIRLTSNPTMEAADIVSVIATGRLADEFVGTGALAGAGTNFALGLASGWVEGLANEGLGLELAQINYEGGDLVIEVGDYLTSRAFWTAGIVLPVGETSRDEERLPILFTLDYALLRWLSAQGEVSGQRGLGGGLNAETAW